MWEAAQKGWFMEAGNGSLSQGAPPSQQTWARQALVQTHATTGFSMSSLSSHQSASGETCCMCLQAQDMRKEH